jgi:F0F1-type ATP synthase membrane subunit b/b'
MELQIQDLVSSIKKDGIDSANQQAAAILADARKQADAIVAEAKSQADKLRDDAKAEIDVFKTSAQLSAQQAQNEELGRALADGKDAIIERSARADGYAKPNERIWVDLSGK